MKTAKQIKDFKDRNRTASINAQQDFNLFVIDTLIGITERMDAMEQPPKVACVENVTPITDEQRDAIERAAMINALTWAEAEGITKIAVRAAITCLKNGGEL